VATIVLAPNGIKNYAYEQKYLIPTPMFLLLALINTSLVRIFNTQHQSSFIVIFLFGV